ncbi:RHS repeat domain-containing protein [Chitinophaga qingshengii]|uniref:RHS repeat protein n=1 Tax=Chitinophaga qingshengii TaxID=1569794 RepID=A0ABR7TJZ6_9BACT|nr:RHS repeat domain-containing protein [Chitinophaga qingshengii]MBC9930800.1 RHS repeat protein [Chitinophaga qingshengii]
MIKYLYCLLIPVLFTACSTHRAKKAPVRLTSIAIQGDTIPQYAFQYDTAGHLIKLVRYYTDQDTNVTTFTYDATHRLTGMESADESHQQKTVVQKATVSAWDALGNITEVHYYAPDNTPLRTARLTWKNGMPTALKYIDSSQAMSWNYANGNPDWKNICHDTVTGKHQDTSLYVRSAQYEWDDTINPLRPLANQLVLGPGLASILSPTPLPDLATFLLPVSTNNPTLIKVDEQQTSIYKNTSQQYRRNTTVQFFYAYKNGYPQRARVHLHTAGYTKLDSDTQVDLDYHYQ